MTEQTDTETLGEFVARKYSTEPPQNIRAALAQVIEEKRNAAAIAAEAGDQQMAANDTRIANEWQKVYDGRT